MIRSNKNNPIQNIRIYKQRFEDLYENHGQVFNPDYIDKVKPFYMFRFMKAFNIGNSQFTTWSQRTTPTYFDQTDGQQGYGLSYEWACKLCNYTQKHMWFNVPQIADDDAVKKMAQTVLANLSPDLNVYLEYSNECFNFTSSTSVGSYLQSKYGNFLQGQIINRNAYSKSGDRFSDAIV